MIKKFLLFLCFALSPILALLIWQRDIPYPNSLTWDIFEHQTLVNQILQGHFAFLPSQISDTFVFNGYTPLFHLFIALLQKLSGLPVLAFWWFSEKIFFFLTVLALGWLAWMVTKNSWVVFFSILLGAFVFESSMAYSPFFLLPQTLSALIWVFAVIRTVGRYQKKQKLLDGWQAIVILAMVLTHFIVGLVGAFMVLVLVKLLENKNKSLRGHSLVDVFLLLSYFFLIFIVIMNPFFSFNPFNSLESNVFNLNILQKFHNFRQWYGFSLPVLAILGTLAVLLRKWAIEKLFLGVGFILIGLTLLPIPYSLKFYVLARYPIHLVMAIGLASLVEIIDYKVLKGWVAVFLIAVYSIIFTNNAAIFKSAQMYQGEAAYFTKNDKEAVKYLRKNFKGDKRILLVSEPATQGIYEALTSINSQGGVYMDAKTRKLLNAFYFTKNPKKMRQLLYQIKDKIVQRENTKVILVLTGRFFVWESAGLRDKMSEAFNIWRPHDLTFQDREYIAWLEKQENFEKVFENKGAAIFVIAKPWYTAVSQDLSMGNRGRRPAQW